MVCIHIIGKSFLISSLSSYSHQATSMTRRRPRRGSSSSPRQFVCLDGYISISCCDPNDQRVDSRRRHAARRFKRRAATLVDAHTDDSPVPVRAPRTTSSLGDRGNRARHDGADGEVAGQGIEALVGDVDRAWTQIPPRIPVIPDVEIRARNERTDATS
ncbi:hypothetical protein EV714DRAFT_237341 [Schizophyllum commune]